MATYEGIIYDLLNPTQSWIDSVYKKASTLIPKIFDLWHQFVGTAYSSEIVVSGGSSFLDDLTFALQNGVIEDVTDYTTELALSGSMVARADYNINTAIKEIYFRLKKGQSITNTDIISLKWLWDTGLGRFRDRGFYQIDYDWVQFYKPSTINLYRTTYIGGSLKSATNSTYTVIPTSASSICGFTTGYEVAKAMDNNGLTEWHHHQAETLHQIGFQLATLTTKVGAVDVLYTGLAGHEWSLILLVSDGILDGTGGYYTKQADSTGCTSTLIKDADADFIAAGIISGDWVRETSTSSFCKVVSVLSSTQLTVDPPINGGGTWNSKTYTIQSFDNVGSKTVSLGSGEQWIHLPFAVRDVGYIIIQIASTDHGAPADTWLYDFGDIQVHILNHETLAFKGLNFEFTWDNRTAGTATGYEFLAIRNVKVTRYKELGSAESSAAQYVPGIDIYDSIWIDATIPFYPSWSTDFPDGIDVGVQLAVSDNGSSWSGWFGEDGTSATYFKERERYIDTLPGGYTGYYFKWKFFLFSDGRDTPILYSFWVMVWLFNYQKELTTIADTYPSYGFASPAMTVPLEFNNVIKDSNLIHYPSGFEFNPIDLLLIHSLAGVNIDLFSGWHRWAIYWFVVSSWLESVVGQVIHGYVRDQNENIILNAFKVLITSTYAFGLDSMGSVEPATGFYELFVKSTIYDNRWLVAHLNTGKTFDVAYRKYGLPLLIDGTTAVPSPMDLHFWIPSQICGKSVAYVGSLVTY